MQAPMTPKFRKYLSNPQNASKLTEKTLLNERKSDSFTIEVGNKNVNIRQIGVVSK